MKLFTQFLPICFLFIVLTMSSCRKEEPMKTKSKTSQNQDADEAILAFDEAKLIDFAIAAYSDSSAPSGNLRVAEESFNKFCGAMVTRKKSTFHEDIYLSFDGTTFCVEDDTCKREGVVQLQLEVDLSRGRTWNVKGAQITMIYHNYTVLTGASGCGPLNCVNVNGKKVIMNTTGGLVEYSTPGESIVHTIKDSLIVKIGTGETKTIKTFKKRTIDILGIDPSQGSPIIQASITGMESMNGDNNVSEWGTDKSGSEYYYVIQDPILYKRCPGKKWMAISGTRLRKGSQPTITVFGVDINGNPVNSCDAYGFKVSGKNFKGEAVETICPYMNVGFN
jgi:hypothetical protein